MPSNEENIINEVIDRYLVARGLGPPIDHGLVWDLSCDVCHDYFRGVVDRHYVESRILHSVADNLERKRELAERRPQDKRTGGISKVDEIASLSDRKLKAAVRSLYENAEKLVEVDSGNKRALLGLYVSELERRGYRIVNEPQVIVGFEKPRES